MKCYARSKFLQLYFFLNLSSMDDTNEGCTVGLLHYLIMYLINISIFVKNVSIFRFI